MAPCRPWRKALGVPFAVELHFDTDAARRVRSVWDALDASGIPSLRGVPGSVERPHVSLAVFDSADLEMLESVLREPLQQSLGLVINLAFLGFFLAEQQVAFLGVAPSEGLLAAHRLVVGAVRPVVQRYWPNYQADALVPHCTLATALEDPARVVDVVARCDLPIMATVTSAHVVEVPGGRSQLEVR